MTQREIDRIEFQMDKLNDQNFMLRNKIDRLRSQLKHEGYLLKNSSGIQREQHNKNCWQLDTQVNECDNQIWQNERELHYLGSQLPRQKSNVSQSPKKQPKTPVQSGSYNSSSISKSPSNLPSKTSKWGHFFKSILYFIGCPLAGVLINNIVTGDSFFYIIPLFFLGKSFYHFFKLLA